MARNFMCTKTDPVVETKAGKLRGFQLDGTYVFHGVKYADAKAFPPADPGRAVGGPQKRAGLRLRVPHAAAGSAQQRADGAAPLLAAR